MMKKNIKLSTKSIQETIKYLKSLKNDIVNLIVPEYLKNCCIIIREMANAKLSAQDIGSGVISDIQTSWDIQKVSNYKFKLVNTSDKAVYIEFGVGVIGSENSHPNAENTGYEYNIPSGKKLSDNSWIFKLDNKNQLDISTNNIINETSNTIRTKGQPATLFVYQSVMDFITTNKYKTLWEQVKAKYIK